MSTNLFQRVVTMTKLSPVFAQQVVELACARAGLSPEGISVANLPKLLEHIEPALALFTSADEAKKRVNVLRAEFQWRR